jgi:aminopeptidase YwaD
VQAALAVTRAVARHSAPLKRGLRLAFFSVEEWALIGSAQYVAGLDQRERDAIALNVNLDSVAGGASLTAMTSGFAGLEPFLIEVAAANGRALRCVRP